MFLTLHSVIISFLTALKCYSGLINSLLLLQIKDLLLKGGDAFPLIGQSGTHLGMVG